MLRPLDSLLLVLALASCRASSTARAEPSPSTLVVERLSGGSVAPLDTPDAAAVCLLFIAPDCPISNVYAPEMERIRAAYGPRRVATYLVYSDPAFSTAAIERHLADFDLHAPALLDRQGRLARFVGATVTPEAAVWVPGRGLSYRGRIDDLYVDFGKKRAQPSQRDLRRALDRALSGADAGDRQPVLTQAIGCFLPRFDAPGSAEARGGSGRPDA